MAISLGSLNTTKNDKPPIGVLYGVHGVGKTELASEFPDPYYLPTLGEEPPDRVALVSTERGGGVKLAFASGGATVSLRTDSGSAEEEIAVAYDGEPIDIGFNSKYVGDVFGIFPAGDIRLALNDGGSPALVTSEAAPDLLAVLMPCRV